MSIQFQPLPGSGWVTSQPRFFASDGKNQSPIHLQGIHCGSAYCSQPHQVNAIPMKMIFPIILARVIKSNILTTQRIGCGLAGRLTQRAGHTSQCQVFRESFATNRNRNDMVNMECGFLSLLRQPTILAMVRGSLNYKFPKSLGDLTHLFKIPAGRVQHATLARLEIHLN
jgi:hypothetical protein